MSYPTLQEMPAYVDVGFQASDGQLVPQINESNSLKDELLDFDKNIEIRTIYVPTKDDSGPIAKKFMVHPVNAATDTLFQISYRYKVSMKEIQRVNQFSGQDIFYMVELLIPYKGQQSMPSAKKQAEP